jgi:hypothetical protein
MTGQNIPGAGHDAWGGGTPKVYHPRAQESPAAGPSSAGLRLTPIERSSPPLASSGDPEDREAISLGGVRQVLIIPGILAVGLLLAFLIHILAF